MSPTSGYPLLQAPQIHPARPGVTGPRPQRGQPNTWVRELALDEMGSDTGPQCWRRPGGWSTAARRRETRDENP
jgi:hypothetical protein